MPKSRAQQIADQLKKPSVRNTVTGESPPPGRVIQQSEKVGMDQLERRRIALQKLHDYKNGIN